MLFHRLFRHERINILSQLKGVAKKKKSRFYGIFMTENQPKLQVTLYSILWLESILGHTERRTPGEKLQVRDLAW